MAVPASLAFPTVRMRPDCRKYQRIRKGGTAMALNGKRRILGVIVVLLLLCEAVSLTVLFRHISKYSRREFSNIIPLTESGGNTIVTVVRPAAAVPSADAEKTSGIVTLDSPSFSAYDENTVWKAETDVEIFRLSYANDESRITVGIPDGGDEKLIAPGTSNRYDFTLANTGDVPLEYHLDMEAWITGTELSIPVKARVWDYENNYLAGSPDENVPVMQLNDVSQDAVLGTGRYAAYTLEWEWPFEQGDDAFDTMLGNLAVDQELALHIRINTTASYNDDPASEDIGILPPQMGDSFDLRLYCAVLIPTILILILSVSLREKREETE